MGCPRCGSSRPSRPSNPPSSQQRPGTAPNRPNVISPTNSARDAISGLRYVPASSGK
nr:MAG TPA: Transcription factor S-II (TFIIS) [Caudoviricetes sp.]